jgi:hypothetical protein
VYGIVLVGTDQFTEACSPELRNCLFAGNAAGGHGGAVMATPGAEPLLENCTIADNAAATAGGGVYAGGGTNFNGIVYFNSADTNVNWRGYGLGMTFDHSCTTPTNDLRGAGNIADDPAFTGSGDHRLSAGSPCIDAGTNRAWMSGAKDLGGNTRIVSGAVDMGAYEKP